MLTGVQRLDGTPTSAEESDRLGEERVPVLQLLVPAARTATVAAPSLEQLAQLRLHLGPEAPRYASSQRGTRRGADAQLAKMNEDSLRQWTARRQEMIMRVT